MVAAANIVRLRRRKRRLRRERDPRHPLPAHAKPSMMRSLAHGCRSASPSTLLSGCSELRAGADLQDHVELRIAILLLELRLHLVGRLR